MLKKENMSILISSSGIENLELFNAGNGQPIKEKLLRQAVKSCDDYATDICIFLEETLPGIFKEENREIDLYFTRTGVRWNLPHKLVYFRYVIKFVKEGSIITLYEANGTV